MIIVNSRFLTQTISGVQRHAIEVSKELNKHYRDIRFVAPGNIIHKDLAEYLNVQTFGKLTGHLWEQFELPKYLKTKGKNDLLVNLANTAPINYKRKIVTVHDMAFCRNPKWYSKKFYYFYKFLIPRIVKNSLRIATVSVFSKKEIIEQIGIDADKVDVVYNGVALNPENADCVKNDNKYGQYILAVSTLDPRKNFAGIVKSFSKLNLPDVNLVIAGMAHRNFADDGLNKLIRNNKNIILTGHVDDKKLISLYGNARLFVYPSFYEGFGIPPLEAMACQCPVLVSNTASLPEICRKAALYCDPYDIDDIADKINMLLNDNALRNRLIKLGLEQIGKFSWQKTAEMYIKIINGLI